MNYFRKCQYIKKNMFYRCSHVHLSRFILIKILLKKKSGRFNPITYPGTSIMPHPPQFFSVRAATLIFSDFYFYNLTRFLSAV